MDTRVTFNKSGLTVTIMCRGTWGWLEIFGNLFMLLLHLMILVSSRGKSISNLFSARFMRWTVHFLMNLQRHECGVPPPVSKGAGAGGHRARTGGGQRRGLCQRPGPSSGCDGGPAQHDLYAGQGHHHPRDGVLCGGLVLATDTPYKSGLLCIYSGPAH